jgi:hypothetical protein
MCADLLSFVLQCSALYTPAPPITTGKHPCDLGPGGGFRPEPTTEAVPRL